MDPKGDQEQDQARRRASPGARAPGFWGGSPAQTQAVMHPSGCRPCLCRGSLGHLQHLHVPSLCPWEGAALASSVLTLGTQVPTAGCPFPSFLRGGGVWDTRGRDSCCKNRKPGVPKKREAGLSIPLTVDFTRCHLWFTRHFSSCFPYVISFNPRKHCLA